jgi:hypothetical protein
MQTRVEHVAQRVAKTPGARALIIRIPNGWKHASLPMQTSADTFDEAKARRVSDLSAKRNLGLLLARLRSWNKIAFIDDDIAPLGNRSMIRLAGQLDDHDVAGMVVREFPDNSVVCHARRLAKFSQDVFVTGAVLGVHCNSRSLSFFPDVYNEDWFFFAKEAAAHNLPQAGHASQAEYDPFATPYRARCEEFGDLLAEGLYALIGLEDPSVPIERQLRLAKAQYWRQFIDVRHEVLTETEAKLGNIIDQDADGRIYSALASLAAARNLLEDTITTDICVNFLDAWCQDLNDWQKSWERLANMGSIRRAMECLELRTWTLAKYGVAAVDSETDPVTPEAFTVRTAGPSIHSAIGLAYSTAARFDTDIRAEDSEAALIGS